MLSTAPGGSRSRTGFLMKKASSGSWQKRYFVASNGCVSAAQLDFAPSNMIFISALNLSSSSPCSRMLEYYSTSEMRSLLSRFSIPNKFAVGCDQPVNLFLFRCSISLMDADWIGVPTADHMITITLANEVYELKVCGVHSKFDHFF